MSDLYSDFIRIMYEGGWTGDDISDEDNITKWVTYTLTSLGLCMKEGELHVRHPHWPCASWRILITTVSIFCYIILGSKRTLVTDDE